jgi:RNA polymerase sigma-70 factor, ECF subfamily
MQNFSGEERNVVDFSATLSPSSHEITELLIRWGSGDRSAVNQLIPLVYRELHKLAKRYVPQQNESNTLQTTALIHEAYIKLAGGSRKHWENRDHFFAVAAKAMRQVLVDHARATLADKRGGSLPVVQFDECEAVSPARSAELIALDDALTAMAKLHPRQSEAVELRYFGGLSVEEEARILNVSSETVMRDLRFAKAWLRRELQQAT